MRLITVGPPKCGTTALRRIAILSGFAPVPGAIIYGEWKRHTPEVEASKTVPKYLAKQRLVSMEPKEAFAQLSEGMFLHGHFLPPTPKKIKTIVILRQPRAAMVSWFRAKQVSKHRRIHNAPTRQARADYKKWIKKSGWKAADYIKPIWEAWTLEKPRDTLLKVHYETLFEIQTLQLIADFLETDPVSLNKLYGKGTKFSGAPTQFENWYDDELEARFLKTWAGVGGGRRRRPWTEERVKYGR